MCERQSRKIEDLKKKSDTAAAKVSELNHVLGQMNAVVNKKSLLIKQLEAALDGEDKCMTDSDNTITKQEAELRTIQKELVEKTARLNKVHEVLQESEKMDVAKTQAIQELMETLESRDKSLLELKTNLVINEEEFEFQLREITTSKEEVEKELIQAQHHSSARVRLKLNVFARNLK